MANAGAALQWVVPSKELSDLSEKLECLLNEKRDITSQLTKTVDENAAFNQLYNRPCGEFDRERIQLNSEIANLRSQLTSRLQSILAIKEKLMREEFERKFQELTLEVRRERQRYNGDATLNGSKAKAGTAHKSLIPSVLAF